jgi:hypothetical protein
MRMAPGYHGARAADRSGSALVPRALLAYDWPPVPATTAFLFCVCQAGAEAAVAEELTALRPGLRRAFARPGLITFKDPSGEVPAEVAIEAVLVRAHGAAIGPAADVNAVLAAVDKYCPKGQAVRLHVFERDIAKPGDEPPGHAYGPLTAAARAQIEAAWAAAPPRPARATGSSTSSSPPTSRGGSASIATALATRRPLAGASASTCRPRPRHAPTASSRRR